MEEVSKTKKSFCDVKHDMVGSLIDIQKKDELCLDNTVRNAKNPKAAVAGILWDLEGAKQNK